MPLMNQFESLLTGFSKLNRHERFQRLLELGFLTVEDLDYLQTGGIKDLNLADQLIENVIGYFQLPLGVATNFRIDNNEYIIPLAVEETSIIAALSKTAKWIHQAGTIETKIEGVALIGQIQFAKINNYLHLEELLTTHMPDLLAKINQEILANMVKRGGGAISYHLRLLERPDQHQMAVLHILFNTCDAMGANIINQAIEYLKPYLETLSGEKVSICILSNLNEHKLTTAKIKIYNVPAELGEKLEEASIFAEIDPFRAATHNKGIMNGIDPVLIATGNDWRAVEAGMHAYACRKGRYQALSTWRYQEGILTGTLKAPIIVGVIGGVTTIHPTAKLCLRMMGIESANHLSRILAAVGLVQNLGALKALCTEGIIQGHMKLHINNLSLSAGATKQELPLLQKQLQQSLQTNKRISLHNAHEILATIRNEETV